MTTDDPRFMALITAYVQDPSKGLMEVERGFKRLEIVSTHVELLVKWRVTIHYLKARPGKQSFMQTLAGNRPARHIVSLEQLMGWMWTRPL